MDGQDRRPGLLGDLEEAALPAAVPDAPWAEAADLAGGEDDYRLLPRQGLDDGGDMALAAGAAHIAHRQQQGAQRGDGGEQVVGDDAHIATHLMHQLQQGEAVEGTDGVVGDDQHPAGGGDVLALAVGDGVAETQCLQHLFDELDAPQVGETFGKLVEIALVEEAPQHPLEQGQADLAAACGGEVVGNDLVDGEHGGLLWSLVDRLWRRRERGLTLPTPPGPRFERVLPAPHSERVYLWSGNGEGRGGRWARPRAVASGWLNAAFAQKDLDIGSAFTRQRERSGR